MAFFFFLGHLGCCVLLSGEGESWGKGASVLLVFVQSLSDTHAIWWHYKFWSRLLILWYLSTWPWLLPISSSFGSSYFCWSYIQRMLLKKYGFGITDASCWLLDCCQPCNSYNFAVCCVGCDDSGEVLSRNRRYCLAGNVSSLSLLWMWSSFSIVWHLWKGFLLLN